MDRNSFEARIEEQLNDLSRENVRFFSWLCAVRALPFLGVNGNFYYWNETGSSDRIQNRLLAVLRALDAARAADGASAKAAAKAAADAARAAKDNANYTAFVVARAACRTAIYATGKNTYSAVRSSSRAVGAAALHEINLAPILLQDLAAIKAGERVFQNDTAIYGEIWNNFQKALCDIGCEYWGNWYAALFAKGFVFDDNMAEIKLRLYLPKEIMEQGAAEVARYIMDMQEKGAERLNETRILVLGEKGSGKTSLSLRLKDLGHEMPKAGDSTEGVDVVDWDIPALPGQPDSEVNVHIWDFAGHVITHAAHRCFMSERCLYILLINGRTEGDRRTDYWLEQIRNYGGDSPVLIFVNMQDNHRIDIPENKLKKAFPSILDFYYIDIGKGGIDLKNFRQFVIRYVRDNPLWKNQKLSAPAYKVKEALRKRFISGNEYIDEDEFDRIANENGVAHGEQDQLLKDLHALGICLRYDTQGMHEHGTMVLNPSWISHGIYRLINWGLDKKKHVLSVEDFPKVFAGEDTVRYPNNKADFLFRLMKTYQLAFFKDTKRIFVPLLLSADRPNEEVLPEFPFGRRLRMEYRADQALPPYTVSRLAVLHAEELDERRSWRFGALLRWRDTDALVEEDSQARAVTVSVTGPQRTEYIPRLRDTLGKIFDDYKGSRPELNFELLIADEFLNRMEIDTHFLDPVDHKKYMQPEEQIIGNARAGQKVVVGGQLIDPMPTISAYNANIYYNYTTINYPSAKVVVGQDHSQTINISFKNCSANLQEDLNFLARSFRKTGAVEDVEFADELKETASDLDEVIREVPPNAAPDSLEMQEVAVSLRKKGLLKRLGNLFDELSDENSDLYKKVKKIRKGVETLQKLGKRYNDVAQWFGLAQIPKPLLGE